MSHSSLGIVKEVNVGIDEGDDGWVRVVLVDEGDDTVSALIPKDVAHNAALALSVSVVDMDWVKDGSVK